MLRRGYVCEWKSGHSLINDKDLLPYHLDLSTWPVVDEDALSEPRRKKFLLRKKAIVLYLAGASDVQLRKKTGEGRTNIYRIITARCLQVDPDGEIYGWRGALHYFRIKSYERKLPPVPHISGAGASGAMQWLFETPKARDLKDQFT